MSSLTLIAVDLNKFNGSLPPNMFHTLPNLETLFIGGNQISGRIPASITNASGLRAFDVTVNKFIGQVPSLGKLKDLHLLGLSQNNLGSNSSNDLEFLKSLENCRKISAEIGNLVNLYLFTVEDNRFEGTIPDTFAKFQKLQVLELSGNRLSGNIPAFIGNLEVFSLFSLTKLLDLSGNSLSGSLPQEVGKLEYTEMLNFSENHLSGDIPGTIGECVSLEYLYLQGNSFHGVIPASLASLKGLQQLDLSRNRLSGSIPKGIQNISFLQYFNVSFNMLEGEVPTEGVFRNATEVAVTGNNNLCGGISKLNLPPCPLKGKKHEKHHDFKLIAAIVSVVSFLLILIIILTIYCMRKKNKTPSFESPTIGLMVKISYEDLYNGTDGFSTRNLIGSGNFGSVYLGSLESEDKVVAIKVLKLQKKGAHKSFIAECNALKNIRHRNLVKILTSCSSTDFKGQEFKALVFEYMKNGNLESWLHPSKEIAGPQNTLNLAQRLSIIIDVASAFHYLHHECEQPVIHCDLKPSNVLLDDSMVAH
ncbi:LRR receptor-like kinase resistance protein, partial [Trifolium pratense]